MRIKSTQSQQPKELEVNVDTVYTRSNIIRIESEEFIGWAYDEEQYNKDEYIEMISTENKQLKEAQAETNTTVLEFMETVFLQ